MKAAKILTLSAILAATGCAHSERGPSGSPIAAAGMQAAPFRPPQPAQAEPSPDPSRSAVRLPERITLPASYRLVLLDGHLTLVRETDPQSLEGAPPSLRIVAGELSQGELGYQPGLLPQELAAEVAANRESSARMDATLAAVLERSRELALQARALQEESGRIASALDAAQGKIARLEAAAAPASAPPRPRGSDPGEPPR